jgi:hypothetical protein
MPINIVVSNDMWNEKNSVSQVSAYDDVNVYVHFDQPISHELEYIEQEVTHFWITLTTQDEILATLKANKVLPELIDEAKTFKNGKFKFPVCSLPNALLQSFHAVFAQKMASLEAGTHSIDVTFETDNPLQKGKALAQTSFFFELTEDAKAHLQKVAEENIAQGADIEEDTEAKKEAFERIKQSSESFDTAMLTLHNKASSDIWVMIGYNSGNKYVVAYQQSITIQVPTGETIYKVEGNECSTNYGQVGKKQATQTLEVY